MCENTSGSYTSAAVLTVLNLSKFLAPRGQTLAITGGKTIWNVLAWKMAKNIKIQH
jgi:hypothetical protein